jgi:hypothetical protein
VDYSAWVTTTSRDLPDAQHQTGRQTLAPLRAVANRCQAGSCPTVYVSDSASTSSTVVVQGYSVSGERAGIDVPDGEMLVEIPVDLLIEAVRRLS